MTIAAVIDGSMVTNFVEDQKAFAEAMNGLFAELDTNHDGVLSRIELFNGLQGLLTPADPAVRASPSHAAIETAVFEMFDGDGSGFVDMDEFQVEMREIVLSMARGIGDSPVHMMIDDDDSFFKCIIDHHDRSKASS